VVGACDGAGVGLPVGLAEGLLVKHPPHIIGQSKETFRPNRICPQWLPSSDAQMSCCGISQHWVGETVGDTVGLVVGPIVGPRLGEAVGRPVGEPEGLAVGVREGDIVGLGVSHTPHSILHTLLMSNPVGLQMASSLTPDKMHSAGSALW
jgi:hypothetical protein